MEPLIRVCKYLLLYLLFIAVLIFIASLFTPKAHAQDYLGDGGPVYEDAEFRCMVKDECGADKKEYMDYIYVGAWSAHFNNRYDYNSNHDLIGYEHEHWGVSTFKNSYYNRSVLLARRFSWQVLPHIEVGAEVGAVTGYRNHLSTVGAWAPVIVPNVAVTYGRAAIVFHVVPEEFMSVGFRWQL